jgi:hypothetical protein
MQDSCLGSITIKGFKSIASIEGLKILLIDLLIGANSSGKSNFPGAFGFLNAVSERRLQESVYIPVAPDSLFAAIDRSTDGFSVLTPRLRAWRPFPAQSSSLLDHGIGRPELESNFLAIRRKFEIPADLNESLLTAPSQSIKAKYPGYPKRLADKAAVRAIGHRTIRADCPNFHDCLNRIESIATGPQ